MDRRRFLRSAGIVAGVASSSSLLAACGSSPSVETFRAGGQDDLTIVSATLELLTGTERRWAFALVERDRTPVQSETAEVYARDVNSAEVRGGPWPATFHPQAGGGLGVYLTAVDVPEPGPVELVVLAGDRIGAKVEGVVDPEDSAVVVPGEPALAVATPTTEDPSDLEELCTQQPDDCGMHDISLDAAMAEGRPVVLLFATPAYCATAVCAPAVSDIDEVRTSRDWGEVAFVHCEIFTDRGQTLTEPVRAWDLPTEPWLFLIDSGGTVTARLDGPLIPSEVADLVEEHLL